MTTTHRFTSLDQAAIFVLGRLEGIANSSRYNLDYEVSADISEISQILKDQIKHFADQKEKEAV